MKYFFLSLSIFITSTAFTQEVLQDPNQNPNYAISRQKYMSEKDKLLASMNTTEQNTYKAFDWSTFKEEKKQNRINRRQERALARINRPVMLRSCNPGYMGWPRPYWGYYNW